MKGFISSRISTGGGIDEGSGLPNAEVGDWTKKIECQYYPNNRNTVGAYRESVFRVASYEITVHVLDWDILNVSMIKLFDVNGEEIAKKEVLTLDKLDDIQRIKITI